MSGPAVRRVAVSGIGAITASGYGVETLWDAASNGRSAVAAIDIPGSEALRVRIAAQFKEPDLFSRFSARERATIDRFAAFAIIAAEEALADANLGSGDLGDSTAVIIGTGIGGAVTSDEVFRHYQNTGQIVDPMIVPKTMANSAASQISIRHGARGPVFAVASACASSAQAIGMGFQMIRSGMVRRAIVGGSEAMITAIGMRAWEVLRVLTPNAARPFSVKRDGMVLGEGAAVLVLENIDDARSRGVTANVEIAGYGTSSDANDLLRPDPLGAARSIKSALLDADIDASEIGYINAHGTGTIANDSAETEALRAVFGSKLSNIPVSSTKPVHGHTIGAAGAIEMVICIKALNHQLLPPTINWIGEDPNCALDCVPNTPRTASFNAAMSNSFAFGGINASLIAKLAQ